MNAFAQGVAFSEIVKAARRIHIRSLADRMQVSERTAYRMVQRASTELPIRLENGVIIFCPASTSLTDSDNPLG